MYTLSPQKLERMKRYTHFILITKLKDLRHWTGHCIECPMILSMGLHEMFNNNINTILSNLFLTEYNEC